MASFITSLRPAVIPVRSAVTDIDRDVLQFVLDAPGAVALVTLVEIRGGASRALGAQMAVREDGLFCGYVSGGCTEAAVASEALLSLERGKDRFLKLGEGSPFFDIVLPCGGGLSLSIHVVGDRRSIAAILDSLAERRPAGLAYDQATESISVSTDTETGWRGGVFHRHYRPQHRLAVVGSGIEAQTLNRVATAAGYDLAVFSADALDEDSSAVVLFHDLDRELPFLEMALASRARYIGALGSTRTHERRCGELRRLGYADAAIARIKGPIGLFGPARDASSLALSILADIAT